MEPNDQSRKRSYVQALSNPTEDLRDRLMASEARNDVLSEQLVAFEAHIKDLEAFRSNHQKVWGALTADELALFARSERRLLEQNPDGFLSKLHDALFCRKTIEDAAARHRVEMEVMAERVRLAEETLPRMKEELAKMRRVVQDQKQQTQIQSQRSQSLEDQLAVVRQDLQRCDLNWRRTGQQKEALEQRVRVLVEETLALKADSTRLKAELSKFHMHDNWKALRVEFEAKSRKLEVEFNARRQADVDSVAACLYEQLAKARARS